MGRFQVIWQRPLRRHALDSAAPAIEEDEKILNFCSIQIKRIRNTARKKQ